MIKNSKSMMKAVLLKKFGDSSNLYLGETIKPILKSNEILIKVKCSAVNRADIVQREGKYPPPKGASEILGLEASGTIEEVNEKSKFKVGENVMVLLSGGGYSEYVTCDEGSVMKIPKGYSFEEAAAIPEVFLTAYQTLFTIGNLSKGKNVLIHAGASGVGTAAIQLAKSIGCEKIITTSSSSKTEICKKLGATLAIDYEKDKEWDKLILEHCKGVDVILDPVGAKYFHQNCNVLGEDGKIVYIAFMSGSNVENFNLLSLFRKRGSINFSTLRARSNEYKADLVKQFSDKFLDKFEPRELFPFIDSTYNLKEIIQAHERCEKNISSGKIILKIDE